MYDKHKVEAQKKEVLKGSGKRIYINLFAYEKTK
jgi:hypothetical protein